MNYLLDTHAFLWLITADPSLSPFARTTIAAADNAIYLSVVSAWEIAVKYRIGRLKLPERPDLYLPRQRERHGIAALDLDEASAVRDHLLPALHRDPFDRMLACQALVHGLTILTADRHLQEYPIRTAW